MKAIIFFFSLILFCSTGAFATYVAVLETAVDSKVKNKVSLSDRQYLTNVLREQAVKQLPTTQNYTIMTRENILQMLPPGKTIEDCEGSCLVETGKNIAADYVCQARVGSFGGTFSLSAELYETSGNKLISSFNGQGADLNELLEIILQKSPDFFKSVKKEVRDFTDPSYTDLGILSVGSGGNYSSKEGHNIAGHKKFTIEIVSTPESAIPTIDGKALSKCPKTPCKVQVVEGKHRFIATHDLYDDADSLVEITENDQRVELNLLPNFGLLIINPKLDVSDASLARLSVMVDGDYKMSSKITLESGIHTVRLKHPCYVPVEFKVAIEKRQTIVFDKELQRAKGGLELKTQYKGRQRTVAVTVDGDVVGYTPFVGEVPLCADISVREGDWVEHVNVNLKWLDVVQHTHNLGFPSPRNGVAYKKTDTNVDIVKPSMPSLIVTNQDSLGLNQNNSKDGVSANAGTNKDKIEDKSKSKVGEHVSTNIKPKKKEIRWVPLWISGATVVTGVTLAVIGNMNAKNAYKAGFTNDYEYNQNRKDARSGQRYRSAGIALAIAGAIGVGWSILF